MSEATDELVEKAQKQLDEHRAWLVGEIDKIPTAAGSFPMHIRAWMVAQAGMIRLRVAKASGKLVSVVYEYPDELFAFLGSDLAPKHLRDSVSGGHVLDPNKPSLMVEREREP